MANEKKRYITVFLFILITVLLTSGLVQNGYAAEKKIKLTFALFQPGTAALSKMHTEYAKEIEKRTNGRVEIQVFQSGSLLGAPAMYQGIRNGIADMGNGISSYSPGNFPFTSIAELPNDAESGWAVSYAQYDYLRKYEPKEWGDVHLLTVFSPGCDVMAVMMGKELIRTLEDWKGKSIRTNHADIVEALGGTVKDVPMAEVFDSISKGVLDGVVGSPEPLRSWKLGDVCKKITINPAPAQPSIMWYNAMNMNTWNSLPPDIQKIFTEVSEEYVGKLGLTWDEQAVAGVEYSKSLGNTIYVLPDEETARWQKAIMTVIDPRLGNLASSEFPREEVDQAWNYFKERVTYWNGQQAARDVTPLLDRLEKVIR